MHTTRGNERRSTRVFKALSDDTRREILHILEESERSVGEIVDLFPLSQPTISRHLSVLREAGLVADQRQGQKVVYRLRPESLTFWMCEFFGRFRHCRDQLRL